MFPYKEEAEVLWMFFFMGPYTIYNIHSQLHIQYQFEGQWWARFNKKVVYFSASCQSQEESALSTCLKNHTVLPIGFIRKTFLKMYYVIKQRADPDSYFQQAGTVHIFHLLTGFELIGCRIQSPRLQSINLQYCSVCAFPTLKAS